MKRHVQVDRACTRIAAALRQHAQLLNERRDIVERMARRPFAEEHGASLATALNEMADGLEAQLPGARAVLASFRDIERQYKEISSDSVNQK